MSGITREFNRNWRGCPAFDPRSRGNCVAGENPVERFRLAAVRPFDKSAAGGR